MLCVLRLGLMRHGLSDAGGTERCVWLVRPAVHATKSSLSSRLRPAASAALRRGRGQLLLSWRSVGAYSVQCTVNVRRSWRRDASFRARNGTLSRPCSLAATSHFLTYSACTLYRVRMLSTSQPVNIHVSLQAAWKRWELMCACALCRRATPAHSALDTLASPYLKGFARIYIMPSSRAAAN